MNEFKIIYKSRVFMLIVCIILLALISTFLIFAVAHGFMLAGSMVLTVVFLVFLISVTLLLLRHALLLVVSNYRGYKEFSLKGDTLKFPLSATRNELIEVKVSQIEKPLVLTTRNSGTKCLQFFVKGKRYSFVDDDFTEKEFSIICNSVVKRSDRCKCCQSTNVDWSGEKGHCFNCETITPKNSDDFDWRNAYQA